MQNLVSYLQKHKKHYNINTIKRLYMSDEVIKVLDLYNFSIEELCYRLRKNISLDFKFHCKYCGKSLSFNKQTKYPIFCSLHCASKFNATDSEINKKRKDTLIKKYGVDNPMKSVLCKEKSKKTCKAKYGKLYYLQTSDAKNKSEATCLQRYNVKNYAQSKEFKSRKDEILEKVRQANNRNYNVDYYVQSVDYKKNKEKILERVYQTKTKNKTWNTSKPEKEVGRLLRLKFKKVIPQYKSEVYPFACDYYIQDTDTYIECNFHWSHMPDYGEFNITSKVHVDKLIKLKKENTKFSNKIIEVWTKTDPLKLETFKKNKLNYKIFYSIDTFNKWYISLSLEK